MIELEGYSGQCVYGILLTFAEVVQVMDRGGSYIFNFRAQQFIVDSRKLTRGHKTLPRFKRITPTLLQKAQFLQDPMWRFCIFYSL